MDRTAFETELREQGYGELVNRRMEANSVNAASRKEMNGPIVPATPRDARGTATPNRADRMVSGI